MSEASQGKGARVGGRGSLSGIGVWGWDGMGRGREEGGAAAGGMGVRKNSNFQYYAANMKCAF